jgi:very-short-patch-repair endonuclease
MENNNHAYGVNLMHCAPAQRDLARFMRHTMAPAEQLLWQRLRANRFFGLKFRRKSVICGLIVDFYCHAERLAIEVEDGASEHERDRRARRREILARAGVRVFAVSSAEITGGIDRVLTRIISSVGRDNPATP